MARFRLLKGSFTVGARDKRQVYKAGTEDNIIESDENLAAQEPGKFERVSDSDDDHYRAYEERLAAGPRPNAMSSNAEAEPTGPTTTVNPGARAQVASQPTTPTAAKEPAKKAPTGKDLEEEYGNFDDHTVNDLKEIASVSGVDLKGASKKEDIVKALRAHK